METINLPFKEKGLLDQVLENSIVLFKFKDDPNYVKVAEDKLTSMTIRKRKLAREKLESLES